MQKTHRINGCRDCTTRFCTVKPATESDTDGVRVNRGSRYIVSNKTQKEQRTRIVTRIILLVLFSILVSNIQTLGQNRDFFENQKITLNSILLEGAIDKIDKYFKTLDSRQTFQANSKNYDNGVEYRGIKQRYIALVNRIELISSKSEAEIKNSYSQFTPNKAAYEKKLISENSKIAFRKFLSFYKKENYCEAAKFINITFFLNFEDKSLCLDKFVETSTQFSEELSELEASIDCGDLENSIFIESRLESLIYFLPDSTKIIKERYFLLKEELEVQKNAESNLLCSADKLYFNPNFSINIGTFLDYSSEFKSDIDYFYELPSNIGLGLSLSFNYQIVKSLYLGFELGLYEYNYNYVRFATYGISRDVYGFKDLNISAEFYSFYLQYKFPNRTIFHPFIRLSYGRVYTSQTVSESNIVLNETIYNTINNVKASYNEFKYGIGVEIFRSFSDNIQVSLLFSNKVRYNDELVNQSSGRFEVILGYYW